MVPPPPKIDHFLCFVSGDTSQNLQGLGLLVSQLHLASTFWLHRMNMLKKPEEIKKSNKSKSSCICLWAAQDEHVEKTRRNQKNQTKSKKTRVLGEMPRSESRKVNKPRRNQKNQKITNQGPGAECPDPVTISLKELFF